MVKELTGGYIIKYHAKGLESDPIEIDFTPPFRFGSFSALSCFGLVYKALRYLCVAELLLQTD